MGEGTVYEGAMSLAKCELHSRYFQTVVVQRGQTLWDCMSEVSLIGVRDITATLLVNGHQSVIFMGSFAIVLDMLVAGLVYSSNNH